MTTITVTAEHIANGIRENCEHCPIALALAEAFPGAGVHVDGDYNTGIAPNGGLGGWYEIQLPHEALEFIWDFDDGGAEKVVPFSFDVDYPAVAS